MIVSSAFYRFKGKIMSLAERKCDVKTLPFIEGLVDGYAQDVLNLLCGEYTEESDKCSKIIHQIPKHTKALNHANFVLPIAEIINSLPKGSLE